MLLKGELVTGNYIRSKYSNESMSRPESEKSKRQGLSTHGEKHDWSPRKPKEKIRQKQNMKITAVNVQDL